MRRVFWLVAAALLLAGCTGEKGIVEKEGYQLDTRRQAQAAYPRIKVLVIHYTADDFDSSLATLTDKQVSSHYLVPAVPPRYNGKPRIWQLVPEQELAWHAGISAWRGATRLNDTSIGIELENRGWQKSAGVKYFAPFEPAQIQALIPLAATGTAGDWCMAGCAAGELLPCRARATHTGRDRVIAGAFGALWL